MGGRGWREGCQGGACRRLQKPEIFTSGQVTGRTSLVSGRQLQPEETDAETEEDHSVTEGPMDESIRPQPQGSSPVYECAAEGAGFGLQEGAPGRQGFSGRRRSWWKRDSGDSRTFSSMSHPESMQGATEVTLKTEVEVGASGYSITGGGSQGIFVKQVLKESSAAKLFSLREGDQLLSATVFFDDIKYEDAVKILQYSEPYKVQFGIIRKLPDRENEEGALSGAQHDPKGLKKQDKEVADGCTEGPTKILEGGGDQDRLLPKAREGRGRRHQKERLSWPKFQAMRPKYGQGPRRSHSSSEAYERGAPDVSPTSTDTEAQLLGEEQELQGSQHTRKFLSLRFRMGSGRPGKGAQGGPVPGVLEEAELLDTGVLLSTEPSGFGEGVPEEAAGPAARRRKKKTKEDTAQEEVARQTGPRGGPASEQALGEKGDAVRELEAGIAKLSLQDATVASGTQTSLPEIWVRIPHLQTPRFGVSKQKVLDAETAISEPQLGLQPGRLSGEVPGPRVEVEGEAESLGAGAPQEDLPEQGDQRRHRQTAGQAGGIVRAEEKDVEGIEGKLKMPKFKMPSFGWSPSKEPKTPGGKHPQEARGSQVIAGTARPQARASGTETEPEHDDQQRRTSIKLPGGRGDAVSLEGDVSLADKDVVTKDSKFKMPKFKMPSFGVSAPSKEETFSVDVSLPRVGVEASLPSLEGNIQAAEVKAQLPAKEVDMRGETISIKMTGEVSVGDTRVQEEEAGLKENMPKVQIPGTKMPKVDLKGIKVDVSLPDVEVSLPKVSVDSPAPRSSGKGVKVEGEVTLRDKDMKTKDSKFKMPSFKIPSFGVSPPSKAIEASVDVSLPEAQVDVSLPSTEGEVKTGDLSIQLPSADVEVKGGEVGIKVPEGQLSKGELTGQAVGSDLKGHLPKFQMPSVTITKVDFKAPQVDIKGPKVDMKALKGEVATPDVDVSLPRMEVDNQVPGTKVEGDVTQGHKESVVKDSKFKMPKFKMPSFGVSAPSKSIEASVDVSLQEAQVDVSLPSPKGEVKTGDLSIQLPSADVEVKGGEVDMKLPEGLLPEGQLPHGELAGQAVGDELKGHLPKFQIPSIKMPKVDFKAPQVDIKGPKVDMKGFKGEVDNTDMEVALPSVEVDIQALGAKVEGDVCLGDKDSATKDSRFKMPKFKMPSFGVSAPSKSIKASVDVSLQEAQVDVALPSRKGEVKTGDLSIQLPSADVEVKGGEVGVKLPEGQLPESQLPQVELAGQAMGDELKGHLPKLQIPSIKVPKVDFKPPQVDIKGPKVDLKGPKLDMKGFKGEVDNTNVEVALPTVEVDIQVPGAKVEGDVSLGDKDLATKDSKFKMPKFKMPSFGVSSPRKDLGIPLDLSVPNVGAESSLPSLGVEITPTDGSIPMPSADITLPGTELDVSLPLVEVAAGELKDKTEGARIKGQLSKVQMPDIKMPKVDLKGPKVDISLPEVDGSLPKVDVDAPVPGISTEGVKVEGDVKMEDKDVKTKEGKFKMPSFKMPSFGVSMPSKSMEASVDVSLPETKVVVSLPSTEAEVKTSDLSIHLTSADKEGKSGEVGVKLPKGQLPEGDLAGHAVGAILKGDQPKFQTPDIKLPKVDFKAPHVDIEGPKMDMKGLKGEMATTDVQVSVPSVEAEIQAPEKDMSLGYKDLATKDSKFKIPKFKMPSFGVSALSKDLGSSVDLPEPKMGDESSQPSLGTEIAPAEGSIPVPSADIALPGTELDMSIQKVEVAARELKDKTEGVTTKGHLPDVQMTDIKMPKVDLKTSKVDISLPKVDLSLPKVEVDAPAPGISMEGVKMEDVKMEYKDIKTKDSKFKMPSFKMPSFGVSVPSKSIEASMDVSLPEAQVDVSLPSIEGEVKTDDLSIQLPSANVEVKGGEVGIKFPEGQPSKGELTGQAVGSDLKGHLPKFQMPSVTVPKVDFKAPLVDIKGPKVDLKGPKEDLKALKGEVATPDVDASLPSVEVDIQGPDSKVEGDMSLRDKDLAAKDSKFKMPKFKMPSFGVSAPSKSIEASVDVSLQEAQVDVSLPSPKGEVKTGDLSIQLPSADVEVKGGEVGVKLPEGLLPEGQLPHGELAGQAVGDELKGHLPKFQIPSIKMPKVDFKAPQVDIKGPKVDMKGFKGEVDNTDMEVALPSVEVDIQALGAKVEGDVCLGDKDLATKDSRFKMPKFKMPSFGVSAPSKSIKASVDVSLQEAQVDVALPSPKGEVKTDDLSIQLPSADVEVKGGEVGVKLPEGQLPESQLPQVELAGQAMGDELKGHLPKLQIPSIKVPKVDFKAPQVDIKGPKVDLKGPKEDLKALKGEVATPDVGVSLPSVEVDIQGPDSKVEGDMSLGDKDLAAKDSKFKMPKFKMPSFGMSAPRKNLGMSVDLPGPKPGAESSLHSLGVEIAPAEGSIPVLSADIALPGMELDVSYPEVELAAGELKGKTERAKIKGHLTKVQMLDIKMPKVELKDPKVDISLPEENVLLPKVDVDAPSPGISMKGVKVEDVRMEDKDIKAKESKFKMPSVKMPSFGTSAPSKSMEASVDMSLPEAKVEVSLPSIERKVKTCDLSVQLPSADKEGKGGEEGMKLLVGQLPEGDLAGQAMGAGLKGHQPKLQMPDVKMPKVDFKAPDVDTEDPKVDQKCPKKDVKGPKGEVTTPVVQVSMPSVEMDIQAPEKNVVLGDKDLATKTSKFKMPKFKVPSFGVSTPSKSIEASMDVSLPEAQVDMSLPSIEGEVKTSDFSIQLPSADMEVKDGKVGVKDPEGLLSKEELTGQAVRSGFKGHLSKFQMPSVTVPKVDFKASQVDVKGPKVDLKGPKEDLKTLKGEMASPDVDMSLPSIEVDIQAPDAKVEGDVSLGDKDLVIKDSKFKMPKFKMPSFSASAPSKSIEASVDVPLQEVQVDVSIPSPKGEVKTGDLSIQLPSAHVEVKDGEVGMKLREGQLPEGQMPQGELTGQAMVDEFKGHLPKFQITSIKMPKVDFKAPQVDTKGSKVDLKGPKLDMKGFKGEVDNTDLEVALPSVEVDIQAPDAKVEGHVSLGDKDSATKDSRFKMPKFRIPSFGVSAPGKDLGTSVDLPGPKVGVESSLPSFGVQIAPAEGSIPVPSADIIPLGAELDVSLPEVEVAAAKLKGKTEMARIKGDLSKVQMPDIKMPTVDLKGPKVDISLPEVDMSLPKVEVDALAHGISMEGVKVEGDVKMEDKTIKAKEGKFKLPSIKMPSFGVSAPSKSTEASVDVSLPEAEVDVSLPSVEGEVKTSDFIIQLPSADVEVQGGKVGAKVPEDQLSKGELMGQAGGSGLKGHLPKFQMPSVTVPKVDFKAPQVDIKGPKVDLKGPKEDLKALKGEVATPDVDVSLPSVKVDIQAPGTKVEGDVFLGDKDLVIKDSKFKMPKFKMPSFGVSVPSKSIEASVDTSLQEAEVDVSLPSPKGEVETGDLSIQLPSADLKVTGGEVDMKLREGPLPEGQLPQGELAGQASGEELKGHLPKFQIPSIRMPKVDFKAPQVDTKGPKMDLKGPKWDMKGFKGEVDNTDMEVALPSVKVDIQAPGAKVEGDVCLGDKDLATKDGKFKMPKLKMPSFRVSAPSKDLGSSVDLPGPKTGAESFPHSLGVEITAAEGSIPVPCADIALSGAELDLSLPDVEVAAGELKGKTEGARIKGQLSKVQMPDIKMPTVDLKGPKVDISLPEVDLSLPKVEVDAPAPSISMKGVKMDGDVMMEDKDIKAKESKFKMPSIKMPSFGVSAPSKSMEASVDVSLSEAKVDVSFPSIKGDVKTSDLSIQLPSADKEGKGGEVDIKLPEGQLPEEDLAGQAVGARLKGHLPKFQMPDIKMPKVDFEAAHVDIKDPKVDQKGPKIDMKGLKGEVATTDVQMSLPSMEVGIQGMEDDVSLGDKDLATKDSKFKMPKFKMPSFRVSAPSKDLGSSVDLPGPKMGEQSSPHSLGVEIAPAEGSIPVPCADIALSGAELDLSLPEVELAAGELKGKTEGARIEGHLPRVQMPKVDLKGPKVDIGLPKVDMLLSKVEVDALAPRISMEGMKVEGDVKMEDKDVKTKYSKFKVPSFKMPSFGVSRPSKSTEASVDVSLPEAQVDVSFPSTEGVVKTGDLSIQLPSANVEVKGGEVGVKFSEGQLSKGELTGQADGSGLEGHLPKLQMPSVTVPKVDFKAPQVDTKGPKVDLKGPNEDLKALKGEVATADVDVSLPSVEVNIQAPSTKVEGDVSLGHKDLVIKDSKFKMPKFKMPSFGVSVPSKSIEASVDVSLQEAQVDVALPSPKGEVKTGDLSIQLPSADVEVKDGEVGVKLPEGQLSKSQLPQGELTGQAVGDELKGHLPKFQEPSIKMPKVDFKAPQVDIKGPKMDLKGPKLDMKGFKGEGDNTGVEVDIQPPGAKVEGDASLGDKDLATKDSKFKLLKFKMPSFGVSAPRKDLGTSVDLSGPKVSAESSLPSLGVAIAPAEGSIPVPCADITLPGAKLDLPLPEVEVATGELKGKTEGARIKGHLPKVQVPDIKLPKVDLKGPKVDVSLCKVDVSLPSVEADAPAPGISTEGVKVEGDVKMEDKDVKTKDGKFKMPSFKMPSFGVSTPSKSLQASVDMSLPEAQVDVPLPFTEGEVKTSDLSIQLPSADVEVKGGEVGIKVPEGQLSKEDPTGQPVGSGLKGHLPKFQMPSVTVPKVDFKAPQVDIKGPKVDLKGPQVDLKALKGEVAIPDMDSSLPSVEKDIQVPGIEVEDDVSLTDKVVKDSKFKLPKFKMPSFGVSAPSKDLGTSVDLPAPKVDANMSLPSLEVESSPDKGSIPVPSADITLPAAELDMSLPEVEVAAGELKGKSKGATIKGHLPKVQIPDIKMPEVDLKGTKVDISLSDVQVPLPKVLLDAPAPKLSLEGTKVEGDVKLGDKDVKTKDSKFKMPSFKMPSFAASVASKSIEASGEVSLPEAQADVSLPSFEGEVKTSDLRIQLPSADMEVKEGEVGVKLPEGQLPKRELKVQALEDEFKGHLPKFQMPRVDFKAPQEVLKGPKVDLKVLKGDKATKDMEVSLPSIELDIQVQGTKVEGDASLGAKDVVVKDSRFRMPRRLSMPSFGKSSGRVATGSSQVAGSVKCPELTVSTATTEPGLSASGPDVPDSSVGVTTALPVGKDGEKSKAKKPHFKMPKGFFPPLKSSKDQVTPHQDSGVPLPQHVSATLPDITAGLSQEEVLASGAQSLPVPKVGLAGLPSAKLDLRVPCEESVLPSSHGVTLTKYQVMLAMATVHAELPPDTIPVPNTDAPLPSHEGSAELQPHDKAPASLTETLPSPGGPLAPATCGTVTFPKFHKPKFGFSVLTAADAEGRGSAAEKIEASPPPCTALRSADAPVCTGLEGHSGPDITAAVAPGEAPPHDTECEAKGSPFKRPRFKLPSLSWSPKEAGPQRDPERSSEDTELSLGLDPDQPGAQTGIHASQVEADADLPPEKDGSKGRMRKSGFAMPKLPFSKVKGGPGLPLGEVQPCLSGPKAAAERTSSDKGVTGGVPDGEHQDPTLGLTKPVHGPSEAEVEVSWPEATTRLPEHDPSLQESSVGLGLKDSPAHPPHREGTAPPMEQALHPASALLGADTHTVESLDGDAQVTGAPAGLKEGWFRAPKFHLPGFWRASTKEKGKVAVAEAQGPGPGGGDAAAGVQTQGANVQGSTEETAVSLQPTDAKADGTASETDSYADVLKRDVHGPGLNLSLATASAAAADLSAPEAGVCPGEGSLPLWMPLGRLSEGQVPPGETDETAPPGPEGRGPTSVEEGAERQLAPTEGPLKLKTSRTEMPAQVSVIQVDRLWEDSVVTVTFPKLKSPRFAFHASSTDADVFVPSVRELPCLGTGTEGDLQGESPGVWGATILKAGSGVPAEQPGDAADSSEASPRSRVRVHIQGARVESQAVTVGSGVMPVSTESSGPEAFPTQIVRESEVPASEIQMPSYGFSLLKVKIPEPPQQARVHVAIHGSQAGGGSEEAPQKAAPEVDPISADLQPDTGEPFEIISSSVSMPRLHACPSEVPAGHQGADSCSDEEPAEILEFSSEDSREVATLPADEDMGQKEKLASKKPSGLFRFWLPNIGFSSSVDETRSDPRDDVQRSAPIETQPEERPEAELPKKQEKAGWFRFPRLGFSSSPTRKSKSTKDEAKLAEPTLQEEGVTFFDTHESFSPEDKEEGELAEAGPACGMETSTARTEQSLLEQEEHASGESAPRPTTK
ncbi:protein AHNAK2 [Dugong dugon]